MREQFIVSEQLDGSRLDIAVSETLPQISRNFAQKLIEEGRVTIADVPCISKKEKLKAGQCVSVDMPAPVAIEAKPEDIELNIVYEDDDLLVVNKPQGMVVHPAAGNYTGTLVNAVLNHCGDSLSGVNGVIRPGIVHRIDKDTSGLLVVAKNDASHNSLAKQLAEHSIKRVYHAIVYNNFIEDKGTVDMPIGRDPKNRLRQAVIPLVNGELRAGARRAVTHYFVEERFGRFTHITAQLETGRTHQIRVHMAYIKHPLADDPLYGPKKTAFGTGGQLLHAGVLGFVHPRTGEYMEFTSPLPAEFAAILDKLREGK